MSLTLYELDEQLRELIEEHTDEHGVLSEEGDRAVDELIPKREEKLLSYGCVIKELEGEGRAIVEESTRMRERSGSIVNRARRLRDVLAEALGQGNKLKDHRASLYWASSVRTVIDRPDKLPWELRKVVDSPDLPAVKKVLQGEGAASLEGIAHLEPRKSLVVK